MVWKNEAVGSRLNDTRAMELRATSHSASTRIIPTKTEELTKNLAHGKDKDFFVSHAEARNAGTAND